VSLRAAINAKCRDCIHDEKAPGTWRAQVAECSCVSCPLWPVRPAPSVGPLANPPRDPASVKADWLKAPVGGVNSAESREPLATPALPSSSEG
jgi:hypothetical protein